MKTIHWAEVQRGLVSRRADKLVRLAALLLAISIFLTLIMVLLSRWNAHRSVSYAIFLLAVVAVLLLIAAFGLLLPLPLIIHDLKQIDEVIAEQTRRRF